MAFSLVRPKSPEEAIALLTGAPGAVPVAGGTDLLHDLDAGRVAAARVVSLSLLPWRRHTWEDGRLTIGSTLPLRTLERDPRLRRDLPGLWEGIRAVGSVALRYQATVGGNLVRASPASDLLPILLALDAEVHRVGPSGARDGPLDGFLRSSRSVDLADGELVAAVSLPSRAPSAYVWQRVRPSHDISQVGVAVARSPSADRWSVALGGVVPRPLRLPSAEAVLGATRPGEGAILEAARIAEREAPFATDRRATEAYRRRLVGTLVRRALEQARTVAEAR